jgi:hypothetical protein
MESYLYRLQSVSRDIRTSGHRRAASNIFSCTPSHAEIFKVRIRSSGSTCRSVGHLASRVHSSGTSETLVGRDPWVPMSLTQGDQPGNTVAEVVAEVV